MRRFITIIILALALGACANLPGRNNPESIFSAAATSSSTANALIGSYSEIIRIADAVLKSLDEGALTKEQAASIKAKLQEVLDATNRARDLARLGNALQSEEAMQGVKALLLEISKELGGSTP